MAISAVQQFSKFKQQFLSESRGTHQWSESRGWSIVQHSCMIFMHASNYTRGNGMIGKDMWEYGYNHSCMINAEVRDTQILRGRGWDVERSVVVGIPIRQAFHGNLKNSNFCEFHFLSLRQTGHNTSENELNSFTTLKYEKQKNGQFIAAANMLLSVVSNT